MVAQLSSHRGAAFPPFICEKAHHDHVYPFSVGAPSSA
jgi:hypothetical protein